MERGKIDDEVVALSEDKVREIALGLLAGTHFASWQLPDHDQNLMTSIFIPLVLMDEVAIKEFTLKFQHCIGGPDQKFPLGVNGYPMFHGMLGITSEDAKRIVEKIEAMRNI